MLDKDDEQLIVKCKGTEHVVESTLAKEMGNALNSLFESLFGDPTIPKEMSDLFNYSIETTSVFR